MEISDLEILNGKKDGEIEIDFNEVVKSVVAMFSAQDLIAKREIVSH